LQAALASLLVTAGSFDQIISYFIFVSVIFIALTVAAIFVLRHRRPGALPYRTPGYPFTPLVFLSLVIVLLVLLGSNNPKQALLGVGVVALGAPVYNLLFRRGSRGGGEKTRQRYDDLREGERNDVDQDRFGVRSG
jgi:APA family basic amino acid/polyamine antiporter